MDEKDILFSEQRNFCQDECANYNCEICDLNEKMELLSNMELLDFKNFCYMLSPHVSEDISKSAKHLLDEHGLSNCTFPSLQAIENAENNENKLIYNLKGKQYLLTDIFLSQRRKRDTFRNILKNPVVERICESLMKNRNFGPTCMEIDSLVVADEIGHGVDDIFEEAHNLGFKESLENKELSYMKITHKKHVSMIAAPDLMEIALEGRK